MIVGVDEVGRGCWAGPVVAGAVLLAEPISGLKDSKKLNQAQRTRLDAAIRERAAAWGLGWVSASEVDDMGLSAAVALAMERALAGISVEYEQIIIDGNYNFMPYNSKATCLVKADDTVPAVSAASIIAKVARDTYMAEMAAKYPGYGFEKHVGYGTAVHSATLQSLGVCELHRTSFAPVRLRLQMT